MLEMSVSRAGGANKYVVVCPSLELSWEKSRLENTDGEVIRTQLSKPWELNELTQGMSVARERIPDSTLSREAEKEKLEKELRRNGQGCGKKTKEMCCGRKGGCSM